jgi:hypothetical protein
MSDFKSPFKDAVVSAVTGDTKPTLGTKPAGKAGDGEIKMVELPKDLGDILGVNRKS